MLTVKPNLVRMRTLAKAYNSGDSMAQVARDNKLTRQRVMQILRTQCPLYHVGVISNEEWVEARNKKWFGEGAKNT